MWLSVMGAMIGCGDASATDDTTDVATTDDVGTETTTGAACTELTSGTWTADGLAFGMAMGVVLEMDVAGCSFTLTDWSMSMGGDLPESGTVDGDQVTLAGPTSYWASCTGTAAADGTSIDGTCADDGYAFSFELDE